MTTTFADRLCQATNDHDIDALVNCFAPDYRNEAPAHPERGFTGREQVRHNWQTIFAGVPDVQANVLRQCTDGALLWSEWEMTGTRRDASAHLMRGAILFNVGDDGRARWARFYLEPVQPDAGSVDEAVSRQVLGGRR